MKIGRRGSINCLITLKGKQGHVAYPDKADNPIPRLTQMLAKLTSTPVDEGNSFFPPSSLQGTVDKGTQRTMLFRPRRKPHSMRFNDIWNEHSLKEHLLSVMDPFLKEGDELEWHCHGESFLTKPVNGRIL